MNQANLFVINDYMVQKYGEDFLSEMLEIIDGEVKKVIKDVGVEEADVNAALIGSYHMLAAAYLKALERISEDD